MIPAGPTKTPKLHQKKAFSATWLKNWLRNSAQTLHNTFFIARNPTESWLTVGGRFIGFLPSSKGFGPSLVNF